MKKDTPKYWFKRRRYGWGWVPVTWQGGAVLLLGLTAVLLASYQMPRKPIQPSLFQVLIFLGEVAVVVIFFLVAAYVKGPKPHWRWGSRPDDNPDEDF